MLKDKTNSVDPNDSAVYRVVAEILSNRGSPVGPEGMPEYVSPSLKQICADFSGLTEFDRAADLLVDLVNNKSKTWIFGDYDADGVCSITEMTCFLREMGVTPDNVFVPDRMTDGHGLSETVANEILAGAPECLIVLDCGTTSTSALTKLAKTVNHILVIDHHGAKGAKRPELPENVVLVNLAVDPDPEIRNIWGIGSAGVLTYCVILHATRKWRNMPDRPIEPNDISIRDLLACCLGLAAVTAVTDMVPLRGLNRAIVRVGLKYASGLNGIRALANAFDRPLDPDKITPEDVGFKYGPVLNAAGRIAHGKTALTLMGAIDTDDLIGIARQAVMINAERKSIQQDVIDTCFAQIAETVNDLENLQHGTLIHNHEFHPGVVGLAASRLLEMTNRPAIVVGMNGSGSARSIEGFNVGDFVRDQVEKGRLLKGGGHAGAAGFSVDPGNDALSEFKNDFEAATKNLRREERRPDLIRMKSLDGIDLGRLYMAMSPFGMENPAILIQVYDPDISFQKWFGQDNRHWKCKIGRGNNAVECVVFNVADAKSKSIQAVARGEKNFNKEDIKYLVGSLKYSFDAYWNKFIPSIMIEDVCFK